MPGYDLTSLKAQEITERVQNLVTMNQLTAPNRAKIRDIMDGGAEGVARLVGKDVNPDHADIVPVANHILKACDRIAQKIGKKPDTKVDTPVGRDGDTARRNADKRARAIYSFDRAAKLHLQLPQAGRWLPGYGFVPWVMKQGTDMNGDPFPLMEPRDPFNAYPGTWTIHQQPTELAFIHVLPIKTLAKMYPEVEGALQKKVALGSSVDFLPQQRGMVMGGNAVVPLMSPSWANQSGSGVVVYEYLNSDGTYWVCPDADMVLSFVPNLCSTPPFVVAKRFSFNKLQGQYDQLIGLIAAQARLTMLSIAAAEMGVHAETNVVGDMVAGRYLRGKGAVNYLAPGSTVTKMNERIPYEVFQQTDRIERMIRAMATYPVTDDSVSPNSFVTEVGLQELGGAIEDEYREYRLVLADALETADHFRLEFMERYYPDGVFHMEGFKDGSAYADTFKPSTHINGHYRTRRVYGAMAGFDDSNKIVVGSILQDKGVISTDDLRENVDGLEDHARIKDRIHSERMEAIMYELMSAGVQQMDPRIIGLVIDQLPEGDRKKLFQEAFEEQEEQQQQEEQMPAGPGGIPDVSTVLNRLTTSGAPVGGVQSIT